MQEVFRRMARHGAADCAAPRTLLLALALLLPAAPRAEEVCEYRGGGDYDARIGLTTIAERRGDALTVRALWTLTARALWFYRFEYRVEEISQWRGERLERVALNTRHFINGRIRRQQWDVFERSGAGFSAQRVQGKRPEELAARHPGFAQHWALEQFGRPWLPDYAAANPEQRSDLSLALGEAPASLVPPFAAAFYLPRTAPQRAGTIALFIPGNKLQNRADIPLPAPEPAPGGARIWRVSLQSERLGVARGSVAAAEISAERLLTTIRFHLAGYGTTADGEIRLLGCRGAA